MLNEGIPRSQLLQKWPKQPTALLACYLFDLASKNPVAETKSSFAKSHPPNGLLSARHAIDRRQAVFTFLTRSTCGINSGNTGARKIALFEWNQVHRSP